MYKRREKRSGPTLTSLISPEPGNQVVKHYDCAFTPCDCVSHHFYCGGLPCTHVELLEWEGWHMYCCLVCGTVWDHAWQLARAEQIGGCLSTYKGKTVEQEMDA